MTTQLIYLYLAGVTPLVLIPIFGYKKNPVYFIIGMQLAFYISHNFYEIYLTLNLYDIDNVRDIAKFGKDIEAHRSSIFSNAINSVFVAFVYVITLGTLFWYIQKIKNIGTQQTLRVFLNSSLFYFLLFLGCLIDILMAFTIKWLFSIGYWHFSIFSFFLVFLFLIKAISIKYSELTELRGKTSKFTWAMLILIIIFYTYLFLTR